LCERCYCRLPTARERKPVGPVVHLPAPKRHKPDKYQQRVYQIWDRIEALSGYAPFYMPDKSLACYCPACGTGTVSLRVLRVEGGVRVKVYSQAGGVDRCSRGCTDKQIAEALR